MGTPWHCAKCSAAVKIVRPYGREHQRRTLVECPRGCGLMVVSKHGSWRVTDGKKVDGTGTS